MVPGRSGPRPDDRLLLRGDQHLLRQYRPPSAQEEVLPVPHLLPSSHRSLPSPGDHHRRVVAQRCGGPLGAGPLLRSGGSGGHHGQIGSAPQRGRGGGGRDAVAGQIAHPVGVQVRHLSQGRPRQLPATGGVQHLPAVHVPSAPIEVPAVLQFFPGRTGGIQAHTHPGEHQQLPHHAAAVVAVLFL